MSSAHPPRFRLYLDEAGDHTQCQNENAWLGRRYLCLLGLMVPMGEHYQRLQSDLEALKRLHLPYDDPDFPPILHREDIVNRRGPFYVLQDESKRMAFDESLITLVAQSPITMIGVVVDKLSHGRKSYRALKHPYHYCLAAMLERYCGRLQRLNAVGDVLAEARGKQEDRALAEEYTEIWNKGTAYMGTDRVRATLTSRELKIKPKHQNVAGLQLADVLAHPVKRDVLVSKKRIPDRGGEFAERLMLAIAGRYNKNLYTGRVDGYGRVLLT